MTEDKGKGVEAPCSSLVPIPAMPRVEVLALPSGEGIDRLWGSSTAWMLELHDERRVLIPLSLICTLESMDADEHLVEGVFDPTNDFVRGFGGGEATDYDGLEVWREEVGDDDDVSVVWEDLVPTLREGELICREEDDGPLEVAPLAMAVPCSEEVESAQPMT